MKKNIPPAPLPPPNRVIKESENIDNTKKDKCIGIFGKLFGHAFRSKYNEEESEGKYPFNTASGSLAHSPVFSDNVRDIIESTKSHKKIYVYDICKRCGKTINKKENIKNENKTSS